MYFAAILAIGIQQLPEVTRIGRDELVLAPGFVIKGVDDIDGSTWFMVSGSSTREVDGATILLDARHMADTDDPADGWRNTPPQLVSTEAAPWIQRPSNR
ncbi:MAG: hypothetical protein ACR2HJ_00760 [Fimbriimonadales bacterium]